MSLGPLMLDLEGPAIQPYEYRRLADPLVGGVILFSRNYQSPEQLRGLVEELHGLRDPHLLVAVDHEGGRVQRFREGFTSLPAAGAFGRLYNTEPRRAAEFAETAGWLMAAELRGCGVDFSFAPVLDLNHGVSTVIGDRAFHRRADAAARLAHSFMLGMQRAGMSAVGKHFPGHGGVAADSHHDLPVDSRRFADLQMEDLVVFERLIGFGLPAVMPAHVVYPDVDPLPAGFSEVWLKQVLRGRLRFQGAIFSDDLSMAGAECIGDFATRARQALKAGCDMVLVCNRPDAVEQVLAALKGYLNPVSHSRLMRLHGRRAPAWNDLLRGDDWQRATQALRACRDEPELPLGDDSDA